MGKKKRGHPDVEDILSRPWCYYCERDFEDLKLLISHQKAKHFKCDRCGKRLNTAGGLSVHLNQVHKENLTSVENALPNRQGLDIEIFGMEGIPEDILQQHNQRIIQNFYAAQAERHAATGNPPAGQGPAKKIKVETPEEIKKRLAEHRARVAAMKANGGVMPPTAGDGQSPAQTASPFPPPQAGYPYPPPGAPAVPGMPVPGVPSYSPPQAYPPAYPPGAVPPPGAFGNLPARPPSGSTAASNLPQRPPQYGAPPYYGQPGAPQQGYPGAASTVDELVASAARPADNIDELIRRAERGEKPAPKAEEAATGDKKGKKEKNARMVYNDSEVSPEEKMALLPRYAVAV